MLIFALALTLGFAPRPQLSEAAFRERIDGMMAACGAPGAAIEVRKDGVVIFRHAHGLADVAAERPYSSELAFEIGSLSKQFTACAILKLAQAGSLALGDTLGERLPDLPEAWRPITLEQVLHHLSGIPDYEAIAGYDYYDEPRTAAAVLAVAASRAPSFAPETRFEYSNTGYYLLSLVVEKVSCLAFDRFLAQQFFEPLGMSSTFTALAPPTVARATGHHGRTGTRVAHPPIAWSSTLGAGGIVSTLADLGRWDEALYTERILPRAWLTKLWEPARNRAGETVPYGAGWFLGEHRGVRHLTHSGQTNGFSCDYARFPDLHLSVLVQANSHGSDVGTLAIAAANHFHPGLNLYSIPIPEDEEPARTDEHREALRQAVLAQGELDLLATGMRDFATHARFAATRQSLEPAVRTLQSFRFLRLTTLAGKNGPLEEYLYRATHEQGETFWTLRFADGSLTSLDWADE